MSMKYSLERLFFFYLIQGHSAEIVSLSFNTTGDMLVTGSFDHTARIWDVRVGRFVKIRLYIFFSFSRRNYLFEKFTSRLFFIYSSSLVFNSLSLFFSVHPESFFLFDIFRCSRFSFFPALNLSLFYRSVMTLAGHKGELSSVAFNFSGSSLVTGSIDRTCKFWSLKTGTCSYTLRFVGLFLFLFLFSFKVFALCCVFL